MIHRNLSHKSLDFTICDSDLMAWSGERMLQYLVWEHLEGMGYEIYGEVWIDKKNKVDLVAINDDGVFGIELKRRREIKDEDKEQIKRYISSEAFSDFVIIIQYKSYGMNDFIDEGIDLFGVSEFFDLPFTPKFAFTSIKEEKRPPFYALYRAPISKLYEQINGELFIPPVELSNLKFEKRFEPKKKLIFTRDNEITIEHNLWKKFREQGYCVLPEVHIGGEESKKTNEIDLLLKNEKETIAIEVKNKSPLKADQIEFYRKVADLGITVWIVAPQKRLKSIQKMLSKKQLEGFQIHSYESLIGTQKSITDF